MKKDYIEERVRDVARYIIDTKSTIRQTAKMFHVCKSTIHKDVQTRLPKIDAVLSEKVNEVIAFNLSMRTIRGGAATKEKFKGGC